MKKENSKKIKLKIIISILIFIIVLLIALALMFLLNPKNENLEFIYDESKTSELSIPININQGFKDYKSYNTQEMIYKSLDTLVKKEIPHYYQDVKSLNESEIKKYYHKNSIKIKQELGIKKTKEFVELANTLKQLQTEELEFVRYIINPNSVKYDKKQREFVLLIEYKDNEKIGVKVTIKTKLNEKMTPTKITGNVEEKYLKYEYVQEEKKEQQYTSPGKVIK